MKYNNTPKISTLVVTKGPVAIAGSISNFLSINGVKAPTAAAITIEQQILKPTTTPKYGLASTKLKLANKPLKT